MKKNEIKSEETIGAQPEQKSVVEASAEAIDLITKASLKVYTKGGNDVYRFMVHARKYVRNMAKDRTPKSAEALNTQFAAIFATE